MSSTLPSPLGGPAPAEVRLGTSPLVRAVAQVRFSPVLRIATFEGVVPLQEELRGDYPLFEQLTVPQLQMEQTVGAPQLRHGLATVWRFSTSDKSTTVSLASDAITLEAHRYEGRTCFLERWSNILHRIEEMYTPSLVLRVGVRYVNRFVDKSVTQLNEYIRPSLIGVAVPELRSHVTSALSEAQISIEEGNLLLRWGILPSGGTVDAGLLPPVEGQSWILDIDASSSQQKAFSGADLTGDFVRLTERGYAIFRWVVTDNGLRHFGNVP